MSMVCSDLAKKCFATTYKESQSKTVNYFWCTKCNVKCKLWIEVYIALLV